MREYIVIWKFDERDIDEDPVIHRKNEPGGLKPPYPGKWAKGWKPLKLHINTPNFDPYDPYQSSVLEDSQAMASIIDILRGLRIRLKESRGANDIETLGGSLGGNEELKLWLEIDKYKSRNILGDDDTFLDRLLNAIWFDDFLNVYTPNLILEIEWTTSLGWKEEPLKDYKMTSPQIYSLINYTPTVGTLEETIRTQLNAKSEFMAQGGIRWNGRTFEINPPTGKWRGIIINKLDVSIPDFDRDPGWDYDDYFYVLYSKYLRLKQLDVMVISSIGKGENNYIFKNKSHPGAYYELGEDWVSRPLDIDLEVMPFERSNGVPIIEFGPGVMKSLMAIANEFGVVPTITLEVEWRGR